MSMTKILPLKWVFFAALPLSLSGCERPVVEPTTRLQTVETLQLEKSTAEGKLLFPAVATAAERAHLSFLVSGEITSLFVKEGDLVKKGDVIAKLDTRDFQIAVNNAQANFNAINSQYQRSKPLLEKGLLAQSEFDELAARRQIASSELRLVKLYLSYTDLKAPIDGMISRVNVERFENIMVGQQVVNIHNVDEIDVLVNVPDRLFINKPSQNEIWDAEASVKSASGQFYDAKVKEFTTEPDPTSGTYTVTLTMPMPANEMILDGMAVEALNKSGHDGLKVGSSASIPYKALVNMDGDALDREDKYVWVLEDDMVRKQRVTTGALFNESVHILSGLTGDEVIVVKGLSQLREGAKVKRVNEGVSKRARTILNKTMKK